MILQENLSTVGDSLSTAVNTARRSSDSFSFSGGSPEILVHFQGEASRYVSIAMAVSVVPVLPQFPPERTTGRCPS
jgi:hypothetical protein